MEVLAGTSGFSYKEWRGEFYPEKLAAAEMLAYYSSRLPAVEINNTFYRLPKTSVLESWASQVPDGFRFVVKASRRITHFKRLREAAEETSYLLETLGTLGRQLGAVFFQLPPNLKKDPDRLASFLGLLPRRAPVAFEFRHESWFDDEVYQLLRDNQCALCSADTDDSTESVPVVATTDWGYLRLRREDYDDAALQGWLDTIRAQEWQRAFVFFKHEDSAAGPLMAERFMELAGK